VIVIVVVHTIQVPCKPHIFQWFASNINKSEGDTPSIGTVFEVSVIRPCEDASKLELSQQYWPDTVAIVAMNQTRGFKLVLTRDGLLD